MKRLGGGWTWRNEVKSARVGSDMSREMKTRFRLAIIRLLFQLSRYGARITKSQKAGTVWPSNSPPFSGAHRIDSEPVGFIHRDASRCLLRDAITSASRQCSVRDECSLRFAIRWLTRDCRSNHRFTSTSLLPLRSCGLSH